MNRTSKLELIKERLSTTFSPSFLEVTDDSDQHAGHAGHGGGGRHFSITISAAHFSQMNRVDAHRDIYAIFHDLIPQEIHALKIKII